MRRISAALLVLLLLSGCTARRQEAPTQYRATFLTLFDTVTTIVGYASDEESFTQTAQGIHDALLSYHKLFDIYNDYEGMANLKTINDSAGVAPVRVDPRIIALLQDCQRFYAESGGVVNVAMGSVLSLWHTAREEGLNDIAHAALPDRDALALAAQHVDMASVHIDAEASTVFLADPLLRLDVGAVAKGWATQRVCAEAPAGLLVSVGGNVCATGRKADDTPWVVGVRNPRGAADDYLHTLYVSSGSVVTSGDYQRAYQVDGVQYAHIIDPNTLFPANLWQSVTIVCADSGLADMLSTALFCLDQQEGLMLLSAYDAHALWVAADGTMLYSPEFAQFIRT